MSTTKINIDGLDLKNDFDAGLHIQVIEPERKPDDFQGFYNLWETKDDIKSEEWRIEDVLEKNSLALIHGKYGSYKSFLVIDMCASVAAGIPWHGHETQQGAVYYIMGEGANGIRKRFKGWTIRRKIDHEIPFYVSKSSADFYKTDSIQQVISDINIIKQQTGEQPVLIAIDTIHRNFSGDENSSQDMAKFIKNAEMLQKEFECCVLAVHHPGKNSELGARGSSSLPSAADTEWRVEYSEMESVVKMNNVKMKEAGAGYKLAFSMDTVEIGNLDSKGRMMTTLVPSRTEYVDDSQGAASQGLGSNQMVVLDTIKRLHIAQVETLQRGGYDTDEVAVDQNEIKSTLKNSDPQTWTGEQGSRRFYKTKRTLEERGLITTQGNQIYLKDSPF